MNREIKFRGKSVIGWVSGYYTVIQDKFVIVTPVIYPYLTAVPVDETTVGQYTGLTDKNGKEIYEGDIVKWIDSDGVIRNDTVVFNNGAFRICNMDYTLNDYIELEVVGNIWENPELLEVKETR